MGVRVWIRAWLSGSKKLGVKPIIYTNNSSWTATGDTTKFARKGHPLWVATGSQQADRPRRNWGGQGLVDLAVHQPGTVPASRGGWTRTASTVASAAISVGALIAQGCPAPARICE